jgi:hypothetical protein
MTSMDVLRQEAAAIGITETEAKKYGNIRHRRTWSLAIEHYLSIQGLADKIESPATPQKQDSLHSTPDRAAGNEVNLKDSSIQLTADRCEFIPPADSLKASPTASIIYPKQEVEETGRSGDYYAGRSSQNRGFQQVVHNHIKALKIASSSRTDLLDSHFSNWICPECHSAVKSDCYLCGGEGDVGDIEAIGWTLAYMELLGCSVKEIEPLRKLSPALDVLEMNFKVCVAIKESSEVLARTEKWIGRF